MGSTRKRGADGSSSRKQNKKSKNRKHQESEDARLPASPPAVETGVESADEPAPQATRSGAATLVAGSPGRARQPSIVAREEPKFVPMSLVEQRLTYQFLQVADTCAELQRDVAVLQQKVKLFESGDVLAQGKQNEARSFYLVLIDGSNECLSDIVISWMLGMDLGGVLRTDDKASLPCFQTKLPYHYAYALLSQEFETFLPLRKVMYHEMGVCETSERNDCFKKYYEHRKSTKEKGPDDIPELKHSEGLLQKFQRLRRQAKNDKIGKPALAHVQKYGVKHHPLPGGWRTVCDEGVEPLDCFFFKVPHSRQLYVDTFRTTHPQVETSRTLVSVAQLATLDQSVDTKAKSNQIKTEEQAKIVANNVGRGKSPSKQSPGKRNTGSSGTGKTDGTKGASKQKGGSKAASRDALKMASAANGSIEAIKVFAASIASAIWENHEKTVASKKKSRQEKDEDLGVTQPCECCWVVDVQRPGSPVAEMFHAYGNDQTNDGRGGPMDGVGVGEQNEVEDRSEDVAGNASRGNDSNAGSADGSDGSDSGRE